MNSDHTVEHAQERAPTYVAPVQGEAKVDVFEAYVSEVNRYVSDLSPDIDALTACQTEMLDLTNRRVTAYTTLASRFSHCESPQEIIDEQVRFYQEAFGQYAESSRRIMSAWQSLFGFEPVVGGARVDGERAPVELSDDFKVSLKQHREDADQGDDGTQTDNWFN